MAAVMKEKLTTWLLLCRQNLEPDLAPWQAESRGAAGDLSALHFLDLLHQIHTEWPEYRRNFIAIVAVQAGRMSWWAYPEARSWCTSRVSRSTVGHFNDRVPCRFSLGTPETYSAAFPTPRCSTCRTRWINTGRTTGLWIYRILCL